jgi:hypothetical protein
VHRPPRLSRAGTSRRASNRRARFARRSRAAPGNGPGAGYSFANPAFSFQQFRSNLVARWEYKPGSSLYFIWTQSRTGGAPAWRESFQGNWNGLWRTQPDNVFLLKSSYWFSL